MIAPAGETLKRTALNATHRASGAKMVDYCGWDMPVEYSGIPREHLAVRTAAGLFDVSHMGEIDIRGPQALALVQHVTCNDASRVQDGQAQYTALMLPSGSAIDDCVVHRLAPDHYFLCVNAANTGKDYAWLLQCNSFAAEVRNVSAEYSQIALQGPRALPILRRVTEGDPGDLRYYWFRPARCVGVDGILARTGYTGEDGFEFYFPPASSETLWNTLLDVGKAEGLVPAGLGARNTLRLEAGFALYGHELDEETTLFEANLRWIVKLEKGNFIGKDTLQEQLAQGVRKRLIGFEMIDRAPARDGYPVWIGGEKAGKVSSGSPAPYLKKNIGMAFVPPEAVKPGDEIQIEIRGRLAPAKVVPLPFYKRPK